ncbi:MAG: 3'-5' exonuclease [Vulcanimicrobiaceae bacterium]
MLNSDSLLGSIDLRRSYAVIDVETTGFNPAVDRVVEAACVQIRDGDIVGTWSSLVNPQRPIPPQASAVHGIYDEDVVNAPAFEHVEAHLLGLCSESVVVAHNASFDLGFLPALAAARPALCSLQLARRAFPLAPNHKNQTLRYYLRLDDDPLIASLGAHRALADALVTTAIFLRCVRTLRRP